MAKHVSLLLRRSSSRKEALAAACATTPTPFSSRKSCLTRIEAEVLESLARVREKRTSGTIQRRREAAARVVAIRERGWHTKVGGSVRAVGPLNYRFFYF